MKICSLEYYHNGSSLRDWLCPLSVTVNSASVQWPQGRRFVGESKHSKRPTQCLAAILCTCPYCYASEILQITNIDDDDDSAVGLLTRSLRVNIEPAYAPILRGQIKARDSKMCARQCAYVVSLVTKVDLMDLKNRNRTNEITTFSRELPNYFNSILYNFAINPVRTNIIPAIQLGIIWFR